jgi:hypothetical protein
MPADRISGDGDFFGALHSLVKLSPLLAVSRFTPAGFFWIGSLNLSYHPAPLYSVKCMNEVVPIEYRQQPLHRPPGVTRSWLNVFAQDAPSVLNGANDVSWSGLFMAADN